MSQEWASCFLEGPYWKRGQVLLLRLHFFKKKVTPSTFISVACLQRRLFSQIHESWEEAMASTACPFREGGKKDVFSTLASLFAFSRASFSNSEGAMCGEFLSTRNEFWTSFADKRKISFSKAQSPPAEEEKNLSIDVDTHF